MKRMWKRQVKRAAVIENMLLLGIYKHLMSAGGYDAENNKPSDSDSAIIVGTAHWILGIDIQEQVGIVGDDERTRNIIEATANNLLLSDEILERLSVRLLYDTASLSVVLKKDKWAQEYMGKHVRIMDILTPALAKWPELSADVDESLFKELLAYFTDKYMPDAREAASQLF